MKLLLVDLDDTLIDTSVFKNTFFRSLANHLSVDLKIIEEIYEAVRQNDYNSDWKDQFYKKLNEAFEISTKNYNEILTKSVKGIPVNKSVLKYVNQFSGTKVIFTLGNSNLQTQKVKSCGLEKYFNDTVITQSSKLSLLDGMVENNNINLDGQKYKDVTLIDDRQDFLSQVGSKYPWIRCINTFSLSK